MFEDIYIEGIDRGKIENAGGGKTIVPYILSSEPPVKWANYFLETINGSGFTSDTSDFSRTSDLPLSGTTKIAGNRVLFICRGDTQRIEKGGHCWDIVAAHVADANKRYRKTLS